MNTIANQCNELIAEWDSRDINYHDLYDKILNKLNSLSEDSMDSRKKYELVVSCEYIFFKLRLLLTQEVLILKQILQSSDCPQVLRPHLIKRDVLLTQWDTKLTTIQNDINNIQKLYYLQTLNK